MAFFRKLKDRLFKSSSRLEEGLDAIVEEGGALEGAPDGDSGVAETGQDNPGAPSEADAPPRAAPAEPAPRPDVPHSDAPQSGTPRPDTPQSGARAPQPAPSRADPAPQPLPHTPPDPAPASVADSVAASVPEAAPDPAPQTAAAPESQPAPAPTPEPTPEPTPDPDPAPEPEPASGATPAADDPVARPGLLGRLLGRRDDRAVLRRALDDDMLEQLEELLITADMGVETALRVTANIAEGRMGRKLSVDEIKGLLAREIARIMDPVARPMPLSARRPQVVLVVGVNGSGKTTTIGKLASQFRAAGKQVVIAAGDTFRAAAVEQLQIWGDRAGVPVLTAPEGSDPASLAYDAMDQAERDGADLLMIDTAGRLQNRADLMEELAKIVRVIRKKDPDAPHNTVLVLDATTGQNAVSQVRTFQQMADVSGLVMTKLDGTAKGGVLVALADQFGLPIHAIGVGEQIDDLAPFDPEEFAAALTGLDR
ncbi:MAG: signal recognition particle-docking protein FtsY [Pseudomonadota bacterium]